MMNYEMAAANREAPDEFRELLIAQLTHCRDMLNDYLAVDTREYGKGQMPHEWGSIDTVDYMMGALQLAHDFLNEGVLGDPQHFLDSLGKPYDDDEQSGLRIFSDYAGDGVANEVYQHYYEGGDENG